MPCNRGVPHTRRVDFLLPRDNALVARVEGSPGRSLSQISARYLWPRAILPTLFFAVARLLLYTRNKRSPRDCIYLSRRFRQLVLRDSTGRENFRQSLVQRMKRMQMRNYTRRYSVVPRKMGAKFHLKRKSQSIFVPMGPRSCRGIILNRAVLPRGVRRAKCSCMLMMISYT